jgi:hypothetical protein
MLDVLLTQPEGQPLEFKRDLSSPKPLLKNLVAFANTAGGRLVGRLAQALPATSTEQATAQVMKLLAALAALAAGPLGLPHRPTQTYRLAPSGNALAKYKNNSKHTNQ